MTEEEKDQGTRPLECGECKKPLAVQYTEIAHDCLTRTVMCKDCPVLQRKLFGSTHPHPFSLPEGGADLVCGVCGTSLDAVRMGAPLGCPTCYDVFEEVILVELVQGKKVPNRITTAKKSTLIHIGKAPGEVREMNPAMRLLALNEALSETLKREDYEQAALLRDQIKALTEEQEKGKR